MSSDHGLERPLDDTAFPRWGERGTPLIYFPTSHGDETEFTRFGLVEACRPWVDSGRLRAFTLDGRGLQSLFHDGIPPQERMRRYAEFERWAADELLEWVRTVTGELPIVVGASYGAHVAANLLFKRPQRVARACGLGGVYGLWHRLDGHHDLDVYYHTPLEYLPRLEDPAILEAIRSTGGIDLYAAERDEWLDSTLRLADVLRTKQLPHRLEVWPAPANHHEYWWKAQLEAFLARAVGPV